MDDNAVPPEAWISSKDILERTGISRATLNNYIRLGILPRPLVQKPMESGTGAKKIGYFPYESLERIQLVQRLKQEGKSIGGIVRLLIQNAGDSGSDSGVAPEASRNIIEKKAEPDRTHATELRLTFEEISFSSYLLDHDFDIVWMNRDAEMRIFKGISKYSSSRNLNNIFRLLFHWEFHRQVANWKDLVQLHMAHAKLVKTGKTWISRLYSGISHGEISVLEKIYDHVLPVPAQTIRETHVSLLSKEGSSDLFRVISLFAREGILFIYVPEEIASHCPVNSSLP